MTTHLSFQCIFMWCCCEFNILSVHGGNPFNTQSENEKKKKDFTERPIKPLGLCSLSVLRVLQDNIQNWFCCRRSRSVQRSAHPYAFPWTPAPTWGLILALILCLGLAEFLQHSNIHISAAEYELCTISSEKEFNDASLVQSASTNEEWFPLS